MVAFLITHYIGGNNIQHKSKLGSNKYVENQTLSQIIFYNYY